LEKEIVSEVTLLSLFLVGLSYGATACMFTCMPFLSPLLLTNSSNIKQSFGVMVPFSMGRVFTYTFLALISSMSAMMIKDLINNPTISQTILGVATILVALLILKNSLQNNKSCCTTPQKTPKTKIGYFFMGAGISLNPCVPVMTLLTASAYATSSFQAISYGFIFGLGAVAASFLVFGVIFSQMAKGIVSEFSKYKKHIEITAAILLIIVGIATLSGYMQL
jgi:cytochrome c biogenesis protein CcdA